LALSARKPFLLRVSPEVVDAVERLAAVELRSTNAQMEVLLREALMRRGIKPKPVEEKPHEPE
jgi:hypothetical protein